MAVTVEQIDNTIRTYEQALKNNPLTEKEKVQCRKKIAELEEMKRNLK